MKYIAILALTILLYVAPSTISFAQTAPAFGASQSFAVLGASTVTSTGPTVITGNVGVSPGTAVTGFPPATIKEGSIFSGATSIAGAAHDDAVEIFKNLSSQSVPKENDLTGKILGQTSGAITLKPGVYNFSSSAQLNATLTLDDEGDPNAVFIFKIGSTLTTASYSKVVMKSGGKGPNVFWQIGSSATIGTYTTFLGNIFASSSITMTTGATTTGRLFAITAAVTMDTNTAFASSLDAKDKDGDGIPDLLDDYPDDARKAFNNYSSITGGSTVAFEDLWPSKADFDMNDLVMSYNYTIVTNANNIVVEVNGDFLLKAAGGNLPNGFAVEFPLARNKVRGLTGATLEDGQSKAVIVLFTNMQKELLNGNTQPGKEQSKPKSYAIQFDVLDGPSLEKFGYDYNPFIFYMYPNSRREVHLMNKPPSDLADKTLFGQNDDATDIAAGRYYVSKTGLPYAINIPISNFEYPIENKDVTQTYLHFADWAISGGKTYIDWFSNTDKSYRNPLLIYTK
jgi:LruC domain-containing protein